MAQWIILDITRFKFKGQQHYRFQEQLGDANGCSEGRPLLELPF